MNTLLSSSSFMNIKETPLFLLIFSVILTLLALVFVLRFVSYLEGLNRMKDILSESYRHLIATSIFILAILLVLWFLIGELGILQNKDLSFLLLFFLKIFLGVYVSRKAKTQGRNSVLWFFLGFIEQSSALIALGISPKLLEKKLSSILECGRLIEKFNGQLDELNKLKKERLLSQSEFKQKVAELKSGYKETLQQLILKKDQSTALEKIESLHQAFETGLISEIELQTKKAEIESKK